MTDKLPPNLLALFAPRPALRYMPHADHAPEDRKTAKISGVAAFLPAMKEYEEMPFQATESWFEKKIRVKAEKREAQAKLVGEDFQKFNPSEDPQVRGDAFKTLFVSRLSYDTKEADLEREFGRFGPIERIRIVTDTSKKEGDEEGEIKESNSKKKKKPHRGYAFIVYEREKDMKAAYKETDGIRIKDRRVLVDVERGRTVKGWRPRRFGGGLGGRGYTKTLPLRPGGGFAGPPAGPGGFRGGFRGGFGGDRGGGFRGGFRGGDRGGFGGGGGRGGIGYQGGGGFGGGRGGYGAGAPPPNAPSGPGGGRGGFGGGFGGPPNGGANGSGPDGGYGDRRNGSYDDRSQRGGGGRYGDRDRSGGFTGSNREPVGPRTGGYSDRDRPREDRDRGYGGRRDDDYSRKRPQEADNYDDPRKRRY